MFKNTAWYLQTRGNNCTFTKIIIMKNLLILLFVWTSFSSLFAQQENLKWYNDMNEASAIADKENKPLLLFFTGSDWCGWCHRLQREVFNTPAFTTWANENVVLVELDFPRNKVLPQNIKEQNQLLQQQFSVQGYPTVWFVNIEKEAGKFNMTPLKNTGYVAGGPDVWIGVANSIIQN